MAREKKRRAHIDVHHFIIFLGAGVYEVLIIPDSCVVDEDVQSSECALCGSNCL